MPETKSNRTENSLHSHAVFVSRN